jgi:hypothetical protein
MSEDMTVVDTANNTSGGTPWNACPDLQYRLDEARVYVGADAPIEHGGAYLPRYGILSLLSRDTPGYVYTHPAVAALCDTAFTDGCHVFFYGPFLEALVESERDNPGTLERVPIWCHELMHKLLEHHRRLKNFPQSIANQAADCSINPRIALMLRERHQKYGPIFACGCGLASTGQIERFRKLSEEQIARELMQQSSSENTESKPGAGDGKKTSYGSGADVHTIPLEQLIRVLEANPDITYVKNSLRLPDSDQKQAIRELEQQAHASTLQKLTEAKRLMQRYGDRYPGRHVDSYAVEILDELSEPKIEWIASLADLLAGSGTEIAYSDDHPSSLFYVDPQDMNLPNEIYLGAHLPAESDSLILNLFDTSASVDRDMLKRYVAEVLGSLDRGRGIGSVLMFWADTIIRGKPLRITRENAPDFLRHIEVRGRGGTDFITPIKEALAHPDIQNDLPRIRALLYFTDLGASPPARSQLPARLPPMAYITTPGCFNVGFANAVRDYARVIEIQEHTVIDLDQLKKPSPHTRPVSFRPRR